MRSAILAAAVAAIASILGLAGTLDFPDAKLLDLCFRLRGVQRPSPAIALVASPLTPPAFLTVSDGTRCPERS